MSFYSRTIIFYFIGLKLHRCEMSRGRGGKFAGSVEFIAKLVSG